MKNAGFSGAWNELKVSYRMPNEIIDLCSRFAEVHIDDPEKIIPLKSPLQSKIFKPFLHWRQINDVNRIHDSFIEEILSLVEKAEPDWLAMPDITFLCPTRSDGLTVNRKLKELNIRTAHTFSEDRQTEQKLKLGFHPEIGLVREQLYTVSRDGRADQ